MERMNERTDEESGEPARFLEVPRELRVVRGVIGLILVLACDE